MRRRWTAAPPSPVPALLPMRSWMTGSVSAASGGTLVFLSAVSGTGTLSAASGSLLYMKAGGALTEVITGAGALELEGAAAYTLAGQSVGIGTVTVAAGATLSGFGSVIGGIVDNGTITATGGKLTLSGRSRASAFSPPPPARCWI